MSWARIGFTGAVALAVFAALAWYAAVPEKVPTAGSSSTSRVASGTLEAAALALPVGEAIALCLRDDAPEDTARAERTNAACSAALQSRQLRPEQVALARLHRGAARVAIGERILAGGDYREALKHYDSAIDTQAPEALALFRRGAALDALGQTDRALEDYDAAIRLDSHASRLYFARGVLLAGHRRAYDHAIADFDKALGIEPNNVDALIRRGDAYSQLGNTGHALVDLDRAVDLAQDNPFAYLARGIVYGRQGDNRRARADYDAALRLDPRNAPALIGRAAVHALVGQDDLALRDLDAAIALQPNNAWTYYNRGYVHFVQQRYESAIADYSAAIDRDSTLGLAYNNRCLTRAVAGRDLVPALADCDRALRLMPLNLDVRETRGFIYLKLGDPTIAIVEYNAALDVDASRPLALYGRGLAYLRIGRRDQGEADRAAARALDPAIGRQFSIYGLD